MPSHHDVRTKDVDLKRLSAVLAIAHELRDFASLLLVEELGPRTLQSLALIAEVVHGAPSRFSDPARFSFAHGGKDAHPFPVPLKTYDESLAVLRQSLETARLGDTRKMDGFRRLDQADRARQNSQHPAFGAARHQARRWRLGIQAAIARAALIREHRGLAFEPEDGSVDVRLVQ